MRWPTNQKNTRVRTTQMRFGGLTIGHVTSRHTT